MSIYTLEKSVEHVDVMVVLGKNIGVGSSPEDIRANRFHLSPESRMNALAAGLLYVPGMKLLFSTGNTAGEGTPAEAEAQCAYTLQRYPCINPDDTILEKGSLNTRENAEEVAKLLHDRNMEGLDIGLLTVGYHALAAALLFKRKGVTVRQHFAAEDVLKAHSPKYGSYIDRWANSSRIRCEQQKELFRVFLLSTIDPDGKALSKITHRTRGK